MARQNIRCLGAGRRLAQRMKQCNEQRKEGELLWCKAGTAWFGARNSDWRESERRLLWCTTVKRHVFCSNVVIKNYSLLVCDTIFLGQWFMKFWKNTLSSCSNYAFFVCHQEPFNMKPLGSFRMDRGQCCTSHRFNIPEGTNSHMHALQFIKKQLQALSETITTQESTEKLANNWISHFTEFQVFRYVTLCHQVSTFQGIVLFHYQSGSPSVPFVAIFTLWRGSLGLQTSGKLVLWQCPFS